MCVVRACKRSLGLGLGVIDLIISSWHIVSIALVLCEHFYSIKLLQALILISFAFSGDGEAVIGVVHLGNIFDGLSTDSDI